MPKKAKQSPPPIMPRCLRNNGGSPPTFKPHHGGGDPPKLKTGDITKWGYRQATDKRRPRACSIFRDLKPGAISSPIDDLLKNLMKKKRQNSRAGTFPFLFFGGVTPPRIRGGMPMVGIPPLFLGGGDPQK